MNKYIVKFYVDNTLFRSLYFTKDLDIVIPCIGSGYMYGDIEYNVVDIFYEVKIFSLSKMSEQTTIKIYLEYAHK